jgi:hypothetical protein
LQYDIGTKGSDIYEKAIKAVFSLTRRLCVSQLYRYILSFQTLDLPFPTRTLTLTPWIVQYQSPRPTIINLQPYDAKPHALDSEPYTLDSEPFTLDSKPYTLDSKPYTLDSKPYTLDYKTYILDSKLYTLMSNPTP